MPTNQDDLTGILKEFCSIVAALSIEKDHTRLLEMILLKAKALTNAEGGTIYTTKEDNCLHFEIMMNDLLNIHIGGTSTKAMTFPPLPLLNEKGEQNLNLVATCAANLRQAINIEDVYTQTGFDLSGTKVFDERNGYRSHSFLTIPMTNHLNELIGVLQLINARDRKTGDIIPFSHRSMQLVESLASLAAVVMTNRALIDAQKELFDALIKLIATSIDEKSAYTADHCRRVPVLTRLIAEAVCNVDKGPLKSVVLSEADKYELDVAAWLHDCGKITTPVHIMDKSTKLEAIIDGIQLVDTRFEVLKRDAIIEALCRQGANLEAIGSDERLQQQLASIDADKDLLFHCNQGGEAISPETIESIQRIANRTWRAPSGHEEPLLTPHEVTNLLVSRGTLSKEDRDIINRHVVMTIQLLESLPYPPFLKRVPLIAGGHHERMDGQGYPNHLKKADMTIEARILAIADVFEALTSGGRPYKPAMTLSQSLQILGKMKLDGHIDPDLFDVFMHAKVYLTYAEKYLDREQIDAIDLATIPGFKALD